MCRQARKRDARGHGEPAGGYHHIYRGFFVSKYFRPSNFVGSPPAPVR